MWRRLLFTFAAAAFVALCIGVGVAWARLLFSSFSGGSETLFSLMIAESMKPGASAKVRFGSAMIVVAPAAAVFTNLMIARQLWRLRRPADPSLCPKCGYDLRESPDGCPECGAGRRAT